MNRKTFETIEKIMLSHMKDSAHDRRHVYRVLRTALQIAASHPEADMDILIASCLLHDIGRDAQYKDPSVNHAKAGADVARAHLIELGWDKNKAEAVADAVRTHRFRGKKRPESIEAKILYDADKLDVAGAMGVARTLLYQGVVGEPIYNVDADGEALDGHEDAPSFLNEYVIKLSRLYDGFYMPEAAEMAAPRARAARDFYESLLAEARGGSPLSSLLNEVLS